MVLVAQFLQSVDELVDFVVLRKDYILYCDRLTNFNEIYPQSIQN